MARAKTIPVNEHNWHWLNDIRYNYKLRSFNEVFNMLRKTLNQLKVLRLNDDEDNAKLRRCK